MSRNLRIGCIALMLLTGVAADARAQWVQEGVYWWYYPKTADMPGQCLGHCGKGCSNSLNPCSPKGYWTMEFMWGPNFVRHVAESEECQPYWYDDYQNAWYGYKFVYEFDLYDAGATFTWHGLYSSFCSRHDHACWSNPAYCIFPLDAALACSGAHPEDWSMDKYIKGERNGERVFLGWDWCS